MVLLVQDSKFHIRSRDESRLRARKGPARIGGAAAYGASARQSTREVKGMQQWNEGNVPRKSDLIEYEKCNPADVRSVVSDSSISN